MVRSIALFLVGIAAFATVAPTYALEGRSGAVAASHARRSVEASSNSRREFIADSAKRDYDAEDIDARDDVADFDARDTQEFVSRGNSGSKPSRQSGGRSSNLRNTVVHNRPGSHGAHHVDGRHATINNYGHHASLGHNVDMRGATVNRVHGHQVNHRPKKTIFAKIKGKVTALRPGRRMPSHGGADVRHSVVHNHGRMGHNVDVRGATINNMHSGHLGHNVDGRGARYNTVRGNQHNYHGGGPSRGGRRY